ncbi:MAG TPA: methyl-accepting chemotaxis protein [Spirochaetia bacterium]|nr:methyl-accepting chemotaxis protein [Spirochaetia bacterium]
MKTPTRRERRMAGFLAAFSLGFGLLSLVSLWWLQVFLGLLWLAGGILAFWRLFPEASPKALNPVLSSPSSDPSPQEPLSAPQSVEEAALEELPPEPALEPAQQVPVDGRWKELLTAVETEWTRSEGLGPALQQVLGNTAFIRENVLKSYEIADNITASAQQAFGLSERVQKGIDVVTTALQESHHQAEILAGHSERITAILTLLSEVSDKIHVLSINASIVSARAGVAGRGFEVVAKEIRSLARETEHSLGDIVEVIDLLQSSIRRVTTVVRDADLETQQEKGSLIEVAGALQGVIMGVEIIKVVSSFAREKSEEQEALIQGLDAGGPRTETRQKVAELKEILDARPQF